MKPDNDNMGWASQVLWEALKPPTLEQQERMLGSNPYKHIGKDYGTTGESALKTLNITLSGKL